MQVNIGDEPLPSRSPPAFRDQDRVRSHLSLGAVGPLSPRQRDCLQLLARGLRIAPIADRLKITTVTVELHLHKARQKLGARTLAEAVALGVYYQQIEPI